MSDSNEKVTAQVDPRHRKGRGSHTKNVLSTKQVVVLTRWLTDWRDLIQNARWTTAKAAEELTRKAGFKVTHKNVVTVAAALEPPVEFPEPERAPGDPARAANEKDRRTKVRALHERLDKTDELIDGLSLAARVANEQADSARKDAEAALALAARFEAQIAELQGNLRAAVGRVAEVEAANGRLAAKLDHLLRELGVAKLDQVVSSVVNGRKVG